MKVERHIGYVNPVAAPQAPDAGVVDKFLADMRAEKEAELAQFQAKWKLEQEARKRAEELSRAKEEAEKAAEWEKWKQQHPELYRKPLFPEPQWQEDARLRAEADEKERRWKEEYRARQEQQHAEWEAMRERQWQETLKRVEAMQAADADKVAEPEPVAPQQERRHYGRGHIRELLADPARTEALLSGRKKRVQERLIKDDPGEMSPKQAQTSRQDSITEAAEDAVDLPYPETSQIGEDEQ